MQSLFFFRNKNNMQQNARLLNKTFISYSGKQVINLIMGLMGAIVDSIVISRFLGVDAIASFQLVLPVTLIGIMLSQVFGTGIQAVCSRCLGSGRIDEAKSFYTVTFLSIIPIALLLILALWGFADTIVAILGANGEMAYLAEGAADYLYGTAIYLALMMFMPTQMNIMFLEGKSKYCMISIGCQLVINITGDFCNVLFLHWGLFGMGLATSVCALVGFLVMLYGKLATKGCIGFTRMGLKMRQIVDVIKIGIPSAMAELYISIQTLAVNYMLLIVATGTGIAAFGVLNSLFDVFSPFLLGISITCMTMAGIFYGERDKAGLRNLFQISLKSVVVVGLIISIVGFPRSLVQDEIEQFKKIDQNNSRQVEQIEKMYKAKMEKNEKMKNEGMKLDGWMFRMRDNYPQFDIEKWAAIHNDNDIKQHYPSINALETRADKFSYGYTMEMNYFIAII